MGAAAVFDGVKPERVGSLSQSLRAELHFD